VRPLSQPDLDANLIRANKRALGPSDNSAAAEANGRDCGEMTALTGNWDFPRTTPAEGGTVTVLLTIISALQEGTKCDDQRGISHSDQGSC
jgi:hypothetical protein